MTKLTKAVLIIAGVVLVTIATAALVVRAYHFRGYFSVGGEFLLPAVAAAVWSLIHEFKNLYNMIKKELAEQVGQGTLPQSTSTASGIEKEKGGKESVTGILHGRRCHVAPTADMTSSLRKNRVPDRKEG